MIGIYKITNLLNGKSYIGQSIDIEQRFKQHKNLKRLNSEDSPLHRAIKKYGLECFSFEILELCKKEELDEFERYYIEKYDTRKKGYNLTDGGQGCSGKQTKKHTLSISESKKGVLNPMFGKKQTDDAISKRVQSFKKTIQSMEKEKFDNWHKKIGEKHKNKIIVDTVRNKISKSLKNYYKNNPITEEKRKNMSERQKGKTLSEETKIKISKRISKRIYKFSMNKELIKEYESATEAMKECKINKANISACCHKRKKSAGGFIWSFDNVLT